MNILEMEASLVEFNLCKEFYTLSDIFRKKTILHVKVISLYNLLEQLSSSKISINL